MNSSEFWRIPLPGLRDLLNDAPMHERQAFAAAEMRVGEFVLIEAKLMQNRGVDIS